MSSGRHRVENADVDVVDIECGHGREVCRSVLNVCMGRLRDRIAAVENPEVYRVDAVREMLLSRWLVVGRRHRAPGERTQRSQLASSECSSGSLKRFVEVPSMPASRQRFVRFWHGRRR